MKTWQVYAVIVCFGCSLVVSDLNCGLLLRNLPGKGVGVFAGKDWLPEQRMELAIGIPVLYESVYWTKLIDYCEGYNATHALLTLGYSMMYNHIPHSERSMIQKHMSNKGGVVLFSHSLERSTDVYFEPNSVIFAGDQIYSHYGEGWFADRGLEEQEGDPAANSITLDRETSKQDLVAAQNHPSNLPGCAQQMTSFQKGVLYAAVDVAAGEYFEVVRALLLPHWASVHAGDMGEFLWRKLPCASQSKNQEVLDDGSAATSGDTSSAPVVPSTEDLYAKYGSPYIVTPYNRSDTEYAVLLTGRGALYSPSRVIRNIDARNTDQSATKVPNVAYDWWYSADSGDGEEQCDLTMFVFFKASRDIVKGEELVVDLIEDTQTGFKYAADGFAHICL